MPRTFSLRHTGVANGVRIQHPIDTSRFDAFQSIDVGLFTTVCPVALRGGSNTLLAYHNFAEHLWSLFVSLLHAMMFQNGARGGWAPMGRMQKPQAYDGPYTDYLFTRRRNQNFKDPAVGYNRDHFEYVLKRYAYLRWEESFHRAGTRSRQAMYQPMQPFFDVWRLWVYER
jgi:hypothetical protein